MWVPKKMWVVTLGEFTVISKSQTHPTHRTRRTMWTKKRTKFLQQFEVLRSSDVPDARSIDKTSSDTAVHRATSTNSYTCDDVDETVIKCCCIRCACPDVSPVLDQSCVMLRCMRVFENDQKIHNPRCWCWCLNENRSFSWCWSLNRWIVESTMKFFGFFRFSRAKWAKFLEENNRVWLRNQLRCVRWTISKIPRVCASWGVTHHHQHASCFGAICFNWNSTFRWSFKLFVMQIWSTSWSKSFDGICDWFLIFKSLLSAARCKLVQRNFNCNEESFMQNKLKLHKLLNSGPDEDDAI